MRRWLVLVASALLCMLSVASPARAITAGWVDTADEYPFVGLLAFYDSDGEYSHRCTGTLVSPTLVLTAGHCTDGMARTYAYFQVTVPDDFREHPTGRPGTPYTHPAYNPNTIENDVGLIELESAAGISGLPTIAPERFLTQLKRSHEIMDDVFVAAGYGGVAQWPPPNITYDYVRRISVSPYAGLTRNNLHLLANPTPTGMGGTCFGDSGGPHFWNDTLMIVSVTSWGDAICRSNDMTQRIDTPAVQAWLEDWGLTAD